MWVFLIYVKAIFLKENLAIVLNVPIWFPVFPHIFAIIATHYKCCNEENAFESY